MAAGDVHSAFADAAAKDGIDLGSASFDWLCEQGHVGLERVAKARRDPALVGPVTAALEVLGRIFARLNGDLSVLHAARENLLLPLQLVHRPTGTVIEVDDAVALHVVPPRRARSVPGRGRAGLRPDALQGAVPGRCCDERRARARARREGVRLRRSPAGARVPRRAAGSCDAGDGPPAARSDRCRGRRWSGRLPPEPLVTRVASGLPGLTPRTRRSRRR